MLIKSRYLGRIEKRPRMRGFTALHLVLAVALVSLVALGQSLLRGNATDLQQDSVIIPEVAEIASPATGPEIVTLSSDDEATPETIFAESRPDFIEGQADRVPVRSKPLVMGK